MYNKFLLILQLYIVNSNLLHVYRKNKLKTERELLNINRVLIKELEQLHFAATFLRLLTFCGYLYQESQKQPALISIVVYCID